MENCLVTKLKGVVNKDLPILGVNVVQLFDSVSNIGYGLKFKARVDSSYGHFTVNGVDSQSVDVEDGTTVDFVKTHNGVVAKEYVYYTSKVIRGAINFDTLAGSTSVLRIICERGYLDGDSTKEVITSTGSLGDMGRFPNLEYFASTYERNISGSLSAFNGCVKSLSINLQSTNITGSLEDFGSAQFANGRTSGAVDVICNGTITLNGEPVANGTHKAVRYTSSGYTID